MIFTFYVGASHSNGVRRKERFPCWRHCLLISLTYFFTSYTHLPYPFRSDCPYRVAAIFGTHAITEKSFFFLFRKIILVNTYTRSGPKAIERISFLCRECAPASMIRFIKLLLFDSIFHAVFPFSFFSSCSSLFSGLYGSQLLAPNECELFCEHKIHWTNGCGVDIDCTQSIWSLLSFMCVHHFGQCPLWILYTWIFLADKSYAPFYTYQHRTQSQCILSEWNRFDCVAHVTRTAHQKK